MKLRCKYEPLGINNEKVMKFTKDGIYISTGI